MRYIFKGTIAQILEQIRKEMEREANVWGVKKRFNGSS